MSDDVVARLRQLGRQLHATDEDIDVSGCDLDLQSVQIADETIVDAIAEINRLRAELASMTDKFNRLKDAAIQLRIADEEICNVRKSTREVFDRLEEAQAALDAIIGFKPPTRKNKEQP